MECKVGKRRHNYANAFFEARVPELAIHQTSRGMKSGNQIDRPGEDPSQGHHKKLTMNARANKAAYSVKSKSTIHLGNKVFMLLSRFNPAGSYILFV